MDAWRTVHLGEVCEINRKSYGVKEGWEFVNYLDTGNITDNKIDRLQYINLQLDKLPSRARRKTKKNSIIYSTVRPIQRHFGIIKSQPENFLISTGFVVIDVNEEVLDADFLYYWLTQKTVTETLQAIAEQGQSTYPAIKPSDLAGLELHLPPISVQKRIAGILACLDRKIELNMQLNENLEIQARALFQAWFIDYTLFDGNVPDNWRKTTLREIAVIKTNSWSPVKSVDIEVEYYSIPNFDANRFPTFEMSSNIKSNKYILTPKSVMISKLNPSTKRIWRPINLSSYLVCSTEFIVYEARKIEQKDYLYSLLDSVPFFNYLCTHTTGSTNSRQRVLPNTTLDFPLYLPPDSIIKNFCQLVMPVYDLIATNLIENKSLVKTRDSLLHLLLSGTSDISKQLNSRLS